MTSSIAPLDALAFGAHPDDAELFAGATLAMLSANGFRTGIVDLTRGETATRGTPELRTGEAQSATRILGIDVRRTLDLGDGDLANTQERRRAIAAQIRELRPRLILTHWREDRHPDHRRAHELVSDAVFLAHVGGFEAGGGRWRPEALAFWPGNHFTTTPHADWVVDTGAFFELKMDSLRAYASQFLRAEDEEVTYISSEGFWRDLETRSRMWGHRIGTEHGEAFIFDTPAHARHPLAMMTAPQNI